MPRFDSAWSARIFDVGKGGTFAFQPDCTALKTRMEYRFTNVLRMMNTAVTISELLEARNARRRAWS